jgi:hypothetical protein
MPSIRSTLDDLLPKLQEMYVVVCFKAHPGVTQVFGPYTKFARAEADAQAWDNVEGWTTTVEPVYPPETKISLLQPTKIGKM